MEDKVLLLSARNLKDIPYKIDSPEALDRAHVKYVLSKGAFMSKTVASVFQKVDLIWPNGGLLLQLFKTKM